MILYAIVEVKHVFMHIRFVCQKNFDLLAAGTVPHLNRGPRLVLRGRARVPPPPQVKQNIY